MRNLPIAFAFALTLPWAQATTLQKLSIDEMIQKSATILRVKITASSGVLHGRDIYTHYGLQVLENLKSAITPTSEVAVPGGAVRGMRQVVPGAPALTVGAEYVVFLWTSRSGVTQVIGLSQGLFSVERNASNDPVLVRPAVTDLMLDKSGRVINDQGVTMSLSGLRSQIQQVLGAGK
jgi:hypothetical protein